MTNTPTYRLGKLPAVHDDRTLKAARYFTPELPPAPIVIKYSDRVPTFPMYSNDAYGDCTEAAAGHMSQLFSALRGKPKTPSTASILARYKRLTGCRKLGDAHDTGLAELDVLNDWRKHAIGTEKLGTFASIDVHNQDEVRQALYIFEGVYIGFGISDPAQLFREFNAQTPWTPEKGQVTEGHAVDIVDCDADGLTCVSWARLQRMTWDFWHAMVDEAYALLSSDELAAPPNGINATLLRSDLQAIGALE